MILAKVSGVPSFLHLGRKFGSPFDLIATLSTGSVQRWRNKAGGNYQTLLNDALKKHIEHQDQPLEEVLRRVVREELHTAQ